MTIANATAPLTPPDPSHKLAWLENDRLQLGADLDLGGALTVLVDRQVGGNLLNSFDWGRQVQMSFYSGPVPFTPGGKEPAPQWRQIGWNPIQSGDVFTHRSTILDHRLDRQALYVRCRPMHWPLDNVPGECEFETWYTLQGPAVRVRARLTMQRLDDTTQYPARNQEQPAVYTNGSHWKLMTYLGDRPFTGDDLVRIPRRSPSGFPWSTFQATEHWAALVNDQHHGLGVFHPTTQSIMGGFWGVEGSGGVKDEPTGYVCPVHTEILDHNLTYDYEYALVVGELASIRQWVYEVGRSQLQPEPRYRFERDRASWHYRDASDTGWPIRGKLEVNITGVQSRLLGPVGFWKCDDWPAMVVRGAWHSGSGPAKLLFRRYDPFGNSSNDPAKWCAVPFEVQRDGVMRDYTVALRGAADYRGHVAQWGLEPASDDQPMQRLELASICGASG